MADAQPSLKKDLTGDISLYPSNNLGITVTELKEYLSTLIEAEGEDSVTSYLKALQGVQEQLANNIYLMGVSTANKTDLLSTLADKVLQIKQSSGDLTDGDYIISTGDIEYLKQDCTLPTTMPKDNLTFYHDFTNQYGQQSQYCNDVTDTGIYLVGTGLMDNFLGLSLQGNTSTQQAQIDLPNLSVEEDFTLYFCQKSTGLNSSAGQTPILSLSENPNTNKKALYLDSIYGEIALCGPQTSTAANANNIRTSISERKWNIICLTNKGSLSNLFLQINGVKTGYLSSGNYSIGQRLYLGLEGTRAYSNAPLNIKMLALYNAFHDEETIVNITSILTTKYVVDNPKKTWEISSSANNQVTDKRIFYWDAEQTGKGQVNSNTSTSLLQDTDGEIIGRIENYQEGAYGKNYLTFNGETPQCYTMKSYISGITSTFTVEATFSVSSLTKTNQYIISSMSSYGFYISINTSNQIQVMFSGTTTTSQKHTLTSNEAIEEEVTYHIVATLSSSGSKLYINGELQNETPVSTKTNSINTPTNNTVLGFGCQTAGFTSAAKASLYPFSGNLQNVKIQEKTLSEEEIINNYSIEQKRYDILNTASIAEEEGDE